MKRSRVEFTKPMKKTHTILIPSMLDFHFPLLKYAFLSGGYKCDVIGVNEYSRSQMINAGWEYSNNDVCFPCNLIIGQFICALKSGKYDLNKVALAITQTGGGSVLSAANIDVKIHHLMMLLSTIPDLEILALDSCECFDTNKVYVKKRLQTEQNEAVRKLLQADYDFLDEIQIEMSTARQFMFAVRFRREKDEQIFSTLNRVDKAISEHGFAARRMTKPEIKRMLALYFGTSLSGENIPDIEGENEFDLEKQEVTVNEK